METVWKFLKKLKTELPYDPEILLLSIYAKEMKTGHRKDVCTPCSLWYYLHVSRYGNSISAINGRMNNEDVHMLTCACTHTNTQKYYSAMRKKEIVPFEPV